MATGDDAPRANAAADPDDMDWSSQQAKDDDAINGLLSLDPSQAIDINLEGPIDQSNKADDAEDFEDISDDDLPDEEDAIPNGSAEQPPALTSDGGSNDNDDDLFGEREDSPLQDEPALSPGAAIADADGPDIDMRDRDALDDLRRLNFDPEPSYPMANQDPDIPAAPENVLELLKQTYPDFERGKILNFNELFPPRKANWVDKKPTRNPKPLVPTKLSLDLDVDQEKLFRVHGPATSTTVDKIQAAERNGLVSLLVPEPINEEELEIFGREDPDADMEPIGGFTLRDIETVCEDWDDIIDPPTPRYRQASPEPVSDDDELGWLELGLEPLPKPKRRRLIPPSGLPEISRFAAPSFDKFEEATSRSAKRVRLDLNDPYLLIDDAVADRPAKRPKTDQKLVRMADGSMAPDVQSRFNISNDDAYEALGEGVREKVRATLGGVQIEHSLPALKLLYPYYQVKMQDANPFSYHRPYFHTRRQANVKLNWSKPRYHKRRDLKTQRAMDTFKTSKDLSLNDNSTAVLLEYCEEVPTVLSNFGMGSKIVNYFRVHQDAEEKPAEKPTIGETKILLPEDRSPFANFGDVGKGEMVPTLWNHMYRAPIFKHEPRKTDFIIGRVTDDSGSNYYLRKIDHIYVVGQNFPSVEVPGPHSRKVTNTSKNRMKMLSYRLISRNGNLSLEDITTHIKDSNMAQNRQKLKEFLQYDKDNRVWNLREGEKLMDPDNINSMVQPEDVCLMDAMQVGTYEAEKAGFAIDQPDLEKDDDNDNIALQLSPWKMTKAFLDATTNKAMLKLRGEGDPTGCGLGFSFIRTSMKGGFLSVYHEQGPQSTSADALEREKKANGGHSYNVKKQNDAYAEVISDIWNKQKDSLSNTQVHDDADVAPQEDEDERLYAANNSMPTPGAAATPRFDEGFSQISRSATSAARNARKILRIVRTVLDADGTEREVEEIIEDPGVIREYVSRRNAIQEEEIK
ncbi:unnamed protein product [Discula destructiva]